MTVKKRRKYWKLKDEALDRTLWRSPFERGYGSVVKQTMCWWAVRLCTRPSWL